MNRGADAKTGILSCDCRTDSRNRVQKSVYPRDVAAFDAPVAFDPSKNGNIPSAKCSFLDPWLALSRFLTHVAKDHSLIADDGCIADVHGIETERVIRRKKVDFDAEPLQKPYERVILCNGGVKYGLIIVVQIAPLFLHRVRIVKRIAGMLDHN